MSRDVYILSSPILILSDCLSDAVSSSFCLQVMKCIVEALADVLSRPRPLPVSQDCLVTLRSGRRLQRSALTELK